MKRLGIFILSIFLVISLTSCNEVYNIINGSKESSSELSESELLESSSSSKLAENTSESVESSSVASSSSEVDEFDNVSFHFIDTGYDYNGDTTYIKAGDIDILIDAGPRDSAAGVIEEYVDQYCTDGKLEYVIATHAHQDHIAGFVGTSSIPGIFDYYEIDNLIQYDRKNTTSKISAKFAAGVEALEANGTNVFVGSDFYNANKDIDPKIELGSGIYMTILDNYYYTHNSSDENDYSVCTLFETGDKTILLTGDLEEDGESHLVELNDLPRIDLFKAGHHGSYTANNDCLLDIIKPRYVVIECVVGKNEYGASDDHIFPAQESISRIGKWTDKIYAVRQVDPYDDGESVSLNGNIVFSFDDESNMTISCSESDVTLPNTTWFAENRVMPEQGQ